MGLWAFSERQRKPHEGPRHGVGTLSDPARLLLGSPVPGHTFAGRRGGNSPCSTCVGAGTQLRLGEMPPQHSWALRVPAVCRAQTQHHGRWGRGGDPDSARLEGWPTSTPKMFRVSRQKHHGQKFCWVMEQKLNSPRDRDIAWILLWDK